ncbi:LolA family protein [Sphingomonas sp. RS2018]
MLKPFFAATLAVAAVPVVAQQAPATQLAQVQRHLSGVTSMTANFTQTDRAGKVVTGTLTLKKPGKARFQYEKGVPLLAVADGNSLYFIDYSVRQVSRWPIGQSPMRVLLDPGKDISGIATLVPTANDNVLSVEVRDPKHPEYGRITLIFQKDAAGPAGLQLQGWVALDSQSNRTTIRLSNQKINVPVSDGAFKWTDPRRGAPRS